MLPHSQTLVKIKMHVFQIQINDSPEFSPWGGEPEPLTCIQWLVRVSVGAGMGHRGAGEKAINY